MQRVAFWLEDEVVRWTEVLKLAVWLSEGTCVTQELFRCFIRGRSYSFVLQQYEADPKESWKSWDPKVRWYLPRWHPGI